MRQRALVLEVKGKYATVEVSRAAMCDGCHKSGNCGGGCALSGLVSNGNKMTAEAENSIGAEVGDVVELETESKVVFAYAALGFIVPIIVSALFYYIGTLLFENEGGAYLTSAVGFVLSFIGIAFIDRLCGKSRCDIKIVNIIEKREDNKKLHI